MGLFFWCETFWLDLCVNVKHCVKECHLLTEKWTSRRRIIFSSFFHFNQKLFLFYLWKKYQSNQVDTRFSKYLDRERNSAVFWSGSRCSKKVSRSCFVCRCQFICIFLLILHRSNFVCAFKWNYAIELYLYDVHVSVPILGLTNVPKNSFIIIICCVSW